MIRKASKSFIIAVVLSILLCLLLTISCSSPTQSKTGNLTGTVILNNDTGNASLDPVDYSGVTVALYRPAELDKDIQAVNLSHPNLGVIITQQTEFDHRLQNPYKTTLSAPNGSFTLKGIKPGSYNLVLMKQGWGVRYLHNVSITDGDNTLAAQSAQNSSFNNRSGKSTVELYPVTELAGIISESFEFQIHHSYIATNNITFTGAVAFSPDAFIWIDPARKMSCYGQVSSPEGSSGYVRLTSSDRMYATTISEASDVSRYYSFECAAQAQFTQDKLSNILSSFSSFGIIVKTPGLTISNMIFRQSRQGLTVEQTNTVTVTKCNVIATDDAEQGGITLTDCENTVCSNLIVKDCKVGLRQHSCEDATVTNCYFRDTLSKSVYNLYDNTGSVTNCTFENSDIAIDNSGESTAYIAFCNINARIGLYNYAQTNWVGAYFTANNNNFDCSQHGIKTFAVFYSEFHLNATYNYWNTTSSSEISGDLIYDRYDVDPSNQDYYRLWGIIDYVPFRLSSVQTAGITTE